MKKNYMKPVMCVVALQHKTHLLQASMLRSIKTAGLIHISELSKKRVKHPLGQIIAITGTGFD